jgi:NAD(P)-dependent dehydrogenase (short-subunit alcohol dehydrogenase family)
LKQQRWNGFVCWVLGSGLLYGGMAKERPYPGSTTVTSINGGVSTLVRAMSVELSPLRVNAIHPGVVGETPYWADKPDGVLDALAARTLTKKLVTIKDVTEAAIFLLENKGVNGVNLDVDGGWW